MHILLISTRTSHSFSNYLISGGILRITVGSDGGENGKQTEKIWDEITGLELFTWIK